MVRISLTTKRLRRNVRKAESALKSARNNFFVKGTTDNKVAVIMAYRSYKAAVETLNLYLATTIVKDKCDPRQRIGNFAYTDSTSVGKERLISPMYSSIAKR
jgi:hypothetical protein